MKPFSDDDLIGMLEDAGVEVVSDGGNFPAVFRDQYEELEVGVGVEGLRATLMASAADVQRVRLKKESVLTVDGDTFKVRRLEPMTAGLTRVVLRAL